MARARFRASYSGIGELARSLQMEAEMRRRAEKIAVFARATAPRDTGDYASRFEVDSGVRTDRAYGSVTNTHPAAFQIEYGTSDTPAHHTLTAAMQAARD